MECFKMAAKKVFKSTPGKPVEGHSDSVNDRGVAVFEPLVSDQELIDQDDQFLIFQYWAKLPDAKQKDAMEEDSELGKRLRCRSGSGWNLKVA
jgi:hypothetical protein